MWSGATPPSNWQGSAIVDGGEDLSVAVVNRRTPAAYSSGGDNGIPNTRTSSTVYVPLILRQHATASGVGNSELLIQNAGSTAITFNIDMKAAAGYSDFTKAVTNLAAGATFRYKPSDDSGADWVGAAVVCSTGCGKIAVTSNFYTGANVVQTFNRFPTESVGKTWFVPLFTVRLANGLNTPVAVQNLSSSTIALNKVIFSCKKDPASPGSDFSVSNDAAIDPNKAYYFNPVPVPNTLFPSPAMNGWFGACTVSTTTTTNQDFVAFVQMRYVGGTDNADSAAAYEARRGNGAGKVAIFPLIQKRVADAAGTLGTAVTIQNLSSSAMQITFTYIAKSGSGSNITVGPCTIAGNTSVTHNHRLTDPNSTNCPLLNATMGDGWQGSLLVTSSDQPIDGFIQLTNINSPAGDTFMAHNANTSP